MNMKKPITKEEALLRMAGLCARSEQCSFDIAKKLQSKGLARDDIRYIIEELISRKFIDHHRFARSFARDKVRFSAWGLLKIRAALLARRIPDSVISEAFAEIDPEDYADAVSRAARAKAMSLDLTVYDDRLKLYRHLMSRGFESSVSSAEVRKLSRR